MDYRSNVERFSGFGDCYDKYRPVPPEIIPKISMNYIGKKPSLIVDLGCGTGLSTFLWESISNKVIGIDPNEDMLNKAITKRNKSDNNIIFQLGYGNDTKLESDCADIITCSSSFQWMEPESTINEVLRILKKNGAFAMYNHTQTPTIDWVAEKAYMDLFQKIYAFLDENREKESLGKLWTTNDYMKIMKKCNEFRFMKEILIHHTVKMNAEGFIGFAFSQGALQTVLRKDTPWINDEISKFTRIVNERLGNDEVEAIYSYSLRLAIR